MKTKIIKARDRFLIALVDWTKKPYVFLFKRRQKPWQQTVQTLRRFPTNTLGKDLAIFFDTEGFQPMPKLEDHDVLHVLLDFKTTVIDEVRMQFFLLGNRKKSCYALFTAFVGILIAPEHISTFIKEIKRGKSCLPIHKWNFEHLLNESTTDLQRLIFQKKNDLPDVFF